MQNDIAKTCLVGYSLMFIVSIGLAHWQGRLGFIFQFPGWTGVSENALIGLMLAATVVVGFEAMRRSFQWAKALDREFRLVLSPLRLDGAILIAISSGIAEEVFFRGLMQPVVGLVAASLFFGALHFPVNRRFIPWTMLATLMGFVLGYVYMATDSLVGVCVAHVTVNFVELREMTYEKKDLDRLG